MEKMERGEDEAKEKKKEIRTREVVRNEGRCMKNTTRRLQER